MNDADTGEDSKDKEDDDEHEEGNGQSEDDGFPVAFVDDTHCGSCRRMQTGRRSGVDPVICFIASAMMLDMLPRTSAGLTHVVLTVIVYVGTWRIE